MSDAEQENTLGRTTRMQHLREELLREQEARHELADHLRELESQLQRLQTSSPPSGEVHEGDAPIEHGSPQGLFREEDQPPQEGDVAHFP